MVVVPEPAVECSAAFAAGSVDRAVGPAVEQGADEALGFPVGLRSARPCAGVVDAEPSGGERVAGRTVGGAVVGEDALDLDAVAGKEDDGAVEKAGRGRGPFVGEDFGVGETAVVVDGDVDVVPAAEAAAMAVRVGAARASGAAWACADALASRLETAELLDVDVNELARTRALVTDGWLEPQSAEPADTVAAKGPPRRSRAALPAFQRSLRPSSAIAAAR